jgi:hypothetical protein
LAFHISYALPASRRVGTGAQRGLQN